jgi:hypothetical protein
MKFNSLRTLFSRKAILPRLRKNESLAARLRCGEPLEARAMLAADALSEWQNHALPTDVNADGFVTPIDALRVINELNTAGARDLSAPVESINRTRFMAAGEPQASFLDVNGDGLLTSIDALTVINKLNAAQGEQVHVRIEVTDLAGNPINNIGPGQDFQIRGFVKDLREPQNDPQRGAFSVFFDVTYDATKMAVDLDGRTILYDDDYPNNHRPIAQITAMPGVLDDIGGIAGLTPLGSQEELVFVVPMTALQERGAAVIGANPEDSQLLEVGLFGQSTAVPDAEILFIGDQVTIGNPPTAVEDKATITEDSQNVPINVLINDTVHPDGMGPLEVTAVTQGANGTVAIAGGGASITYTPNQDFVGEDTFTYTVADDNGDQATATVTVTVTNVNDPPSAMDDTFIVEIGSVAQPLDVLANDLNPDPGDALKITAVTDPSGDGTVTISQDGKTLLYTPAAGFTGSEAFTYTVEDNSGSTSQASVIVLVEDDPNADPDNFTVAEDSTNNTLDVLANDELAPGVPGTLMISAVSAASNGGTVTVAANGLSLIYTPAANFNGEETFTYTLVDGRGGTDTGNVTMTVTSVNDPPDAKDDALSVLVNSTDNELKVLTNDSFAPDTNETLMITDISVGDKGGTLAIPGSRDFIRYTPVAGFTGTETFTYTISDGNGGTDTATVTVAVQDNNQTPDAVDDAFTVAEDSTANSFTVLANDTDPDAGDTLTITAVGETSGDGTVTIAGDSRSVIYTPGMNFTGTETFTYTISDGRGGTDTATVTVTVTAVNDAPLAVDDTRTTAEDTALTIDPATLLANDNDFEGDTLTLTAVGNAVNGTVVLDGGMITFTPTANFNGNTGASFEYTVSDGNGGTDTGVVTVAVTAVNDDPVAVTDTQTTVEDTPLTIDPATLVANDTDVDGNTLTVTDVGTPVGGTVVLNGGMIIFTPASNFSGTASFLYMISDGNGGTDTGMVEVTVTPVNDPPVAVDDTRSTLEDTALTIDPATLVANDTDPDTGDTLTITAVSNPVNGTVALAGGMITFTPTAGFLGDASFEYTVSDGNGGTDTGLVTITVTDNAAPIAGDDTVPTTEDTPLSLNPATLLGNDTDADGDTLTITAVSNAINGTVALSGGLINFTPDANFNGAASFVYTVSDGKGGTDTATVTVNVAAANDAPVAENDDRTTVEDTALTIDVATLLANDTDVENNTLTITAVGNPTNGTVTLNGNMITFTPAANFVSSGTSTAGFDYTVSDGNGGTDTGRVTVTVTAVNDAPSAANDTFEITRDSANNTLNVLANDSDPDTGTNLTITAVGTPTSGTVTIASDSLSLIYTPNPGFVGEETFTYTISDGTLTSTATVTVNVTAQANSSLSGFVYVDSDGDGVKDTGEQPLAGVTIRLQGRDIFNQPVNLTAVTDSAGAYRFSNLSAGSYVIEEVQPSQFLDGAETAGSGMSGAIPGHDQFFIILAADQNGTNNNFGERGLQPGFINRANFFKPLS